MEADLDAAAAWWDAVNEDAEGCFVVSSDHMDLEDSDWLTSVLADVASCLLGVAHHLPFVVVVVVVVGSFSVAFPGTSEVHT